MMNPPSGIPCKNKISQKESVDSMVDYIQKRRMRKLEKSNADNACNSVAFEDTSDDGQNTPTGLNQNQPLNARDRSFGLPNTFQIPFDRDPLDFDSQIISNSEIRKEVVSLRIALAARQSLLNELQNRIKKANRILNHRFATLTADPDLAISSAQFQDILASHRKFVRWLNRFTIKGIEDISKFEELNISRRTENSQTNYYVETTVPIDGVEIAGVFIPIPLNVSSHVAIAEPELPLPPTSPSPSRGDENADKTISVSANVQRSAINNERSVRSGQQKSSQQEKNVLSSVVETGKTAFQMNPAIANTGLTKTLKTSQKSSVLASKKLAYVEAVEFTADAENTASVDLPDEVIYSFADFNNNLCFQNSMQFPQQGSSKPTTPKQTDLSKPVSLKLDVGKSIIQNLINKDLACCYPQGPIRSSNATDLALEEFQGPESKIVDVIPDRKYYLKEPSRSSPSPQNGTPKQTTGSKTCAANFSLPQYCDSEYHDTEELYRRVSDKASLSSIALDSPEEMKASTNLSKLNIFPSQQSEENKSVKIRASVTEEDLRNRMNNFKKFVRASVEDIGSVNSNESEDDAPGVMQFQSPPAYASTSSFETVEDSHVEKYSDLSDALKAQDEELHAKLKIGQSSRQMNESRVNSFVAPNKKTKETSEQPNKAAPQENIRNTTNPFLPKCFPKLYKLSSKNDLEDISESSFDGISSPGFSQKCLLTAPTNLENQWSQFFQDESLNRLRHAFELNEIVVSFDNILSPLMNAVQQESLDQPTRQEQPDDLLSSEVETLRKQLSQTAVYAKQEATCENTTEAQDGPQQEPCKCQRRSKIPTPCYKYISPRGSQDEHNNTVTTNPQIVSPRKMPVPREQPRPLKNSANNSPRVPKKIPQSKVCGQNNAEKFSKRTTSAPRNLSPGPRCRAAFDMNGSQARPRSIPTSPRVNPNPLNPNPKTSYYTTEYGAAYNRFGWKKE